MKYFLTGLLGHACPHLTKILLDDGHEIHALIRGSNGNEYISLLDTLSPNELSKITFHYGDLKDYQSIERIFKSVKFDGVFHLAAQSHPPTSFKDPILTMETNVVGTMNIVLAMQIYNNKAILCNVSTSEVYGDSCKDVGVLKEDMALRPSNPYGWSKMAAETFVTERCRNGFIRGFNTRAFSHLAPRRGKNFSISWDAYHLALMVTGKKKEKILPVGNLNTQRVVIDARDCMKAYYLIMQNFHDGINGESFNVCGDISTVKKMEYFTNKLISLSGLIGVKTEIDKRVYRPIDIQIQVGDTTKLVELTGWKPAIPIEKTLADVFNYWVKKLS